MNSFLKPGSRTVRISFSVGVIFGMALLSASAVFADGHRMLSLQPMLGTAGGGATIDRAEGGSFNIEDSSGTALGVRLTLQGTPQSERGMRFALQGDINWHDLSATKTDATLGLVTFENTWSGAISGRAGYDFGRVEPYVSLGLGFSDLSVGTNGQSPTSRLSAGPTFGLGLNADITANWSIQVDAQAISAAEFTPRGGGSTASGGIGMLRLGVVGLF